MVAVLVGHNHTMCATTFAGRPTLVGGGVVSSVTLDQEPLDHLWLEAPPTLAVHLLGRRRAAHDVLAGAALREGWA